MFHKAIDLKFREGPCMDITFQDGKVVRYNVECLFNKYPQLKALEERKLFLSGKLMGYYGIVWTDDLDLETETIYNEGVVIRNVRPANRIGEVILKARAKAGLSQRELAARTQIDQSDISKIERGISNPTIDTIEKIAVGLGGELEFKIKVDDSKLIKQEER